VRLTLVRNATQRLELAGRTLLLDPDLAPRGSRPSFTGRAENPLVDLPSPAEQVVAGAEAVVVSHLHGDHFDPVAQQLLPKDVPLFCQPGDAGHIRELGFAQVVPVRDRVEWEGIVLTRTDGRHALGPIEAQLGRVSGFVFEAAGEPVIYWAGDTVLCDEVREAIHRFEPAVIVTHSSGATWPDGEGGRASILMDAEETLEVCLLAPRAVVLPVHLDSLDHGTVTRDDLRARARDAGIPERRLLVLEDGEAFEDGDAAGASRPARS
jgi:L-ascorbate metabolism protein UlaG (beta-lactamase superfamily)